MRKRISDFPKIVNRKIEIDLRVPVNKPAAMDIKLIEEGLKKPGKSKGGLARALGRQPSAVTAILNGRREIKAREISIIARYLELDGFEDSLLPVRIVPIVESSKDGLEESSPVDTIKDVFDRLADLERRMAAMESVMRAIGAFPKKR